MKNRIYKFDTMKFMLIILVVFGHFVDFYTKQNQIARSIFIFIYSFHMPLFIFLAGLFIKKVKSIKKIDYKKITFYVILALFMKFIIFSAEKLVGYGVFDLFGGTNASWFLIVVSLYHIIVPLLNKINLKSLFVFSILLSLFIGYDSRINSGFYLSRLIVFFPFFLLGYILSEKKYEIVEYATKPFIKMLSVIILLVFLTLCIFKLNFIYQFRGLFVGGNPYSWIPIYKFAGLKRFICYIIQFVMSFAVLTVIPKKRIRGFTKFGSKTLQVYAFHMPILVLLEKTTLVKSLFYEIPNLFFIFLFLVSTLISYILSTEKVGNLLKKLKKVIFK